MTLSPDSPTLPLPDDEALAHSERLKGRLKQKIELADQWIGFAEFMRTVLYEPGLGYYSAGASKFGVSGDFTTAPETSSLFAQCLATQIHDVLLRDNLDIILELGAGTGRLASDILSTLSSVGTLPKEYRILEVSADLRGRQQDYLSRTVPHAFHRIRWLDRLPEESFSGVVLANEVADALPVERFQLDDYGVLQSRGVTWKDGFCDALRPASGPLLALLRKIRDSAGGDWNPGYQSEVCVELVPWLKSILRTMEKGLMLLVDYGYVEREYYLPERSMGTLMCHYRHHAHPDPYHLVGLQDITAWVNFSQVAQAAQETDFDVAGFTNQGHFLLATGSDQFESMLSQADDLNRARLIQEIRTLTMPDQMGERFKVMALTRGCETTLKGFGLRDFRSTL
ncbi:MAG: SAM-dependent methyltransferase [Pseudomonadota bacterium]